VSFAITTFCVASQRVFIDMSVYFFMDSVRKLLDILSYYVCMCVCVCVCVCVCMYVCMYNFNFHKLESQNLQSKL
jgi:hypothetical protein